MTGLAHAISQVPALRLEAFTDVEERLGKLKDKNPDAAVTVDSVLRVMEQARETFMYEVRVWMRTGKTDEENKLERLTAQNIDLMEACAHLSFCEAGNDPAKCSDQELHQWAVDTSLVFMERMGQLSGDRGGVPAQR